MCMIIGENLRGEQIVLDKELVETFKECAQSLMRHLDGIALEINTYARSVTHVDDVNLFEVLVESGLDDWRVDAFIAIFWLADAIASDNKEFLGHAKETLEDV